RLIKINGLNDIVGNDAIVLPRLSDGVDLHREEDGDVVSTQFASEYHGSGGSPTLAKENDASRRFFVRAQATVMVFVDETNNALIGRPAMTILENLHIR